jgi:hypothetical protein
MNKPLQFSVKDIDGNVKNLSDYLSQLQNSNNLLILADESRNAKKASEVFSQLQQIA